MTPRIIIVKRQGKDVLERVHKSFAGKKSRFELYSGNITKILILILLLYPASADPDAIQVFSGKSYSYQVPPPPEGRTY
jgi:hypothetical protein